MGSGSDSRLSLAAVHNGPEGEERIRIYDLYKEEIAKLPKEKGWTTDDHIYKYQGFWYQSQRVVCIEGVMAVQDHFRAYPTDILLASYPKSGTAWLKALGFAIVNRQKYSNPSDHPLLTINPQFLVPLIETSIYKRLLENDFDEDPNSPRLLATHIPYSSLPESFFTSGCRIVYICRNPKDVLISSWMFFNKLRDPSCSPITLEDAFDMFTRGASLYGPLWDHVLGYYKASLQHPNTVLFLTYEDMKKHSLENVKRMAEFLGCPFTEEEEANGVVEKIVELCSFEKLSNIEVNKNGFVEAEGGLRNDIFFRKGTVGDSENYLTPKKIQILEKITEEKFHGTTIKF